MGERVVLDTYGAAVLRMAPDSLLLRVGQDRADRHRANRLLRWLEVRGAHPTLAEVEAERARRGGGGRR